MLEVEGFDVQLLRLLGRGFAEIRTGDLIDTYARSAFEDTRRKAEKFVAHGTAVTAVKPGS